jgi:hypothetical protein
MMPGTAMVYVTSCYFRTLRKIPEEPDIAPAVTNARLPCFGEACFVVVAFGRTPCVPESSHRGRAYMSIESNRREIAREAKAIVALAFRNGAIEKIHAGKLCPACAGRPGISRITDDEMKTIMKNAVNQVYALLVFKEEDPDEYESKIRFGERYTAKWDEPEMPRRRRVGIRPHPGEWP